MKHIAIVMAAGSGKRMGSNVPKQFLEINGKPILYYPLKVLESSFVDEIILVTRHEDISYCKDNIVDKYSFKKVTKIVAGGAERYDSVYAGLKAVDETDSYIYIQDGARPMLSHDILERTREDVVNYSATVVAMPVKDTIKIADENGKIISTPGRETLWTAQTPQAFSYAVIKAAYDLLYQAKENAMPVKITDDGQVVENYSSVDVHITKGDYSNIKVTTPEDINVAEKFLENL